MKKSISMLLAAMMLTGALSGCGGSSSSDSQASGNDSGVSGAITVISREDGSGTRGAFIELTPNLSGLAEDNGTLRVGDHVAVYIRAIVPETLKIKLSVLHRVEPQPREPLRYVQTEGHIRQWRYGNEHFAKCYTIF